LALLSSQLVQQALSLQVLQPGQLPAWQPGQQVLLLPEQLRLVQAWLPVGPEQVLPEPVVQPVVQPVLQQEQQAQEPEQPQLEKLAQQAWPLPVC
jgi:hypothetical protein